MRLSTLKNLIAHEAGLRAVNPPRSFSSTLTIATEKQGNWDIEVYLDRFNRPRVQISNDRIRGDVCCEQPDCYVTKTLDKETIVHVAYDRPERIPSRIKSRVREIFHAIHS